MSEKTLLVKKLGDQAKLPQYATAGSAGLDLAAAIAEPVRLDPGQRALIPTGLALEMPKGCEGQVRPRSGLAVKHGLTVLNAPGTIDEDYRGEVKIVLINLGQESVAIEPGMRIAQLVIAPVLKVEVHEVGALENTSRGDGGFGHTGAH